jgi:enterochelin esterase-like enzyme
MMTGTMGTRLMMRIKIFCTLPIAFGLSVSVLAQVKTEVPPVVPGAKPVTVEHIKVRGTALEGNLEGNDIDRDVIVLLPPTYSKQKNRRFPVVFALHGYSIGAEQWTHEIHVPQTVEAAFALGSQEMIVVLPDSKTVHNGSMYSSSVTTGDFEQFIAHDLVGYIDAHYRTIPKRTSRGLVGHSMGGYGASRIGMKCPDVFGSLYIMSPCCLSPRGAGPVDPDNEKALEAVKTPADSAKLPFRLRAQLASAASWSPNPRNPPLYLDLPTKNGEIQPDVVAKWAANAPLAFVDQHIRNLRQYQGISIDVGDQDGLRNGAAKLHEVLGNYGIANTFDVYKGTHTSAVADRFQNHVLPFFSKRQQAPAHPTPLELVQVKGGAWHGSFREEPGSEIVQTSAPRQPLVGGAGRLKTSLQPCSRAWCVIPTAAFSMRLAPTSFCYGNTARSRA